MRHLMSPLDFDLDELDKVLDLANDIETVSYTHLDVYKRQAYFF